MNQWVEETKRDGRINAYLIIKSLFTSFQTKVVFYVDIVGLRPNR